MVSGIFRRISLALVVLISASLAACSEEVSVEVGLKWYQDHKTELMALHQMLVDYPAIERATPGNDLEFAPKYEEFDAETEKIYREVERRAVELGLQTISVYRPRETFDQDLYAVSYVIATRGLAITENSAVKMHFISDAILLGRYKGEDFRVLVPLDEPDWYVHYYEKE